jgi:hypothetical protein
MTEPGLVEQDLSIPRTRVGRHGAGKCRNLEPRTTREDAHTLNAVMVLLNKLNNCNVTIQLTGTGIRISAKGILGLIVAAMTILLLLLLKWFK